MEKYTLSNGLTLLVEERHHIPIVTTMIWYRVGSKNENYGQTGVSHILEHMLFKGTTQYQKGDIDRITMLNGGMNNAFTHNDYTAYFFDFSNDRWEVALEIEANRMQYSLFDPEEFESERKVILEELYQSHDQPWQVLEEELDSTLYKSHSYHHPVIGWVSDIEHVTRDEVFGYYKKHYHPSNAILVVVGDVDTPHVLQKVKELFETIPAGERTPPTRTTEIKQRGTRRFVLQEKSHVGRLALAFHTVPIGHNDLYALDIAEMVLGSGRASRYYQKLVEELALVTYVGSNHLVRQEGGLFHISAELKPDVSLERVEQVLLQEVECLKEIPPSAEELQRAKNRIEASFIFDQQEMNGLAFKLGYFETISDYTFLDTYVEKIKKVTPNDIQRVVKTYCIYPTIGWSEPMEKEKND